MNRRPRVRPLAEILLAIGLVVAAWLLPSATSAAEDYGRAIFLYEFEVGKGVTPGGDGLGPVFNHRSCVGCHSQGGVGGGGPLDVNVQMLAASRAEPPPASPGQMCGNTSSDPRKELKSLHAAFVSNRSQIVRSIILHRFGADERYAEFRARLGGLDVPAAPTAADRLVLAKRMNALPVATVKLTGGIQVQSVQRNTPALFGAGLIDQIPDVALHVEASVQASAGVVSGRVPPIGHDRVGRFGWRGQTEHLSDFVIAACANELGLEVPGQPQPRDPLQPNVRPRAGRLDLTKKHCDALTAFVAALPRPKFVPLASAAERERAEHGRALFASVGCAACHVRSLDGLDEIYSDLLLHDLGPELADPVGAEFALTLVDRKDLRPEELRRAKVLAASGAPSRQLPSNPSPYGGGSGLTTLAEDFSTPVHVVDVESGTKAEFRRQFAHVDREWRTPPLWGVADSAPYMHDGRAATLNEAISLHGGEAQEIKQRYFELSGDDRRALVEFLSCLRAPE